MKLCSKGMIDQSFHITSKKEKNIDTLLKNEYNILMSSSHCSIIFVSRNYFSYFRFEKKKSSSFKQHSQLNYLLDKLSKKAVQNQKTVVEVESSEGSGRKGAK